MSAPADWSVSPLSDLVAPDAPIGYGIVQPGPSVRDGVPMIAIRDLLNVIPEKLHRTAPAIDANYRRSRVVPGDVLISVKGTTGRIGVVPPNLSANISRDVARLRFRRDQVPGYWMQLLRSEGAQRILDQARVGTTRQELSIGTLKTLEFSYPPTVEQRAISERLADADRLVGAIAALIAKKRDVKQGMMQDLLSGRVRLAGFSSPWVERRIADVAEIAKGVQLGRAEMTESGSVPVWNGGVVPSGFTDAPNVRRPVVTISEGGNSCGWVGRPDGEFWLGGHCYSVDPRGDGHSVAFLYHRLKAVEPSLMALRVGSGLPNIQKKRLGGFVILVPTDASEAAAVASMFDDVDAELSALGRRLESARALKSGMMQELLTGRTRLPVEAA